LRALTGEPRAPAAGPAEDLAWDEVRARDAEQDGDTFAAVRHLDHLLAARPDDWLLHARRGRALSHAGRLHQAAAAYAAALRQGRLDDLLAWYAARAAECKALRQDAAAQWYRELTAAAQRGLVPLWERQALLCLQAGDGDGYRRLCASLLERIGAPSEA